MFHPVDSRCVDIPRQAGRDVEHRGLIKRCMSSQPLRMFRLETDNFLLCYDKFGVYIDKGGILVNGPFTIEWEGVAERAAYRDPYVLLFSSGFVEVRDAVSGRLEQIIRGDSMRCIWEGNGSMGKNPNDGQPSQNLSFIGVMNTPAGLDELAVQCIFTLVPSKPSHSPTQTQTSITEHSNL